MKKAFNRISKNMILTLLLVMSICFSLFFFNGCSCSGMVVLTKNELDKLWENNIVCIDSYVGDRLNRNGTGVIFGYEENIEDDTVYPIIVTNKHVVSDYGNIIESIKIKFNGDENSYTATALGYDSYHDIAILKLNESINRNFYNLFDSNEYNIFLGSFFATAQKDERVYTYGNAGGEGVVSFDGICDNSNILIQTDYIDSISSSLKTVPVVSTTATIKDGMSGGPVVNSHGQIVGIGTYMGTETISGLACYAVDINIILKIYNDVVLYEKRGDIELFGYINENDNYVTKIDNSDEDKPLSVLCTENKKLLDIGFRGIRSQGAILLADKGEFFNKEGYDEIDKIDNKVFSSYNSFLSILYEYEVVDSEDDRQAITISIRNSTTNTVTKVNWETENYKVVKKTNIEQKENDSETNN